jgi:hypothetical protein
MPVLDAEEVAMPRSSLRSLQSAALAVGATGVLSISIPLALLLGTGTIESTAAVQQSSSLLQARLVVCGTEQPVPSELVRAGQCLLVQASGFASRERIRVRRLDDRKFADVVQADAGGRMTYHYQVPADAHPGAQVLSFIGQSVPNPDPAINSFVKPRVPQVAFCRLSISSTG